MLSTTSQKDSAVLTSKRTLTSKAYANEGGKKVSDYGKDRAKLVWTSFKRDESAVGRERLL